MTNRHPSSAREVALQVLVKVDRDLAYSNLLLHQAIAGQNLARIDAALVTELVYGTIQRQNTLDFYLSRFLRQGADKLELWVRVLLRLSLFQILYLDRIPPHAAVNEAVNIAKSRGHRGVAGLVNGVLRSLLREKSSLRIPQNLPADERLSLIHSHPLWLIRRWIAQYGMARTEAICAANNVPPRTSLRANALQIKREKLREKLTAAGYAAVLSEVSPDGIVVSGGGNPAQTELFRQGYFSIQDESSMLVARAVDPQPGMTVLDCCAAPGGKTTHLAERMRNVGTIWANDLHIHKKQLIEAQADRLRLSIIRATVGDAARLGERFAPHTFDRVLLDAPCSGLGVIRRKPEMKWRKTDADIEGLTKIQLSLLKAAAPLVKPGGILVYSTCTTVPAENEEMVRTFLAEAPEFAEDDELPRLMPADVWNKAGFGAGMLKITPDLWQTDGFFIARLRKQTG
ncbi:MAG TPA: 16S rRNA (cytosine(967)-C(5))-methyltransferase RsmB [Bacilli bacterium]